MYRSILFNCWIALFAFTIYFIFTISQTNGMAAPLNTIVFSLLWAVVGFFGAYGIRAVINYVLYTPEFVNLAEEEEAFDIQNEKVDQVDNSKDPLNSKVNKSTIEFQDENSEEIAQVVRTMMNNSEPIIEN